MGQKIQANYASLQSIKGKFDTDHGNAQQVLNNIMNAYAEVRNTWEGQGATAFFNEMENNVIPRTKKMISAFEQASQITSQLIAIFQQAAEESSNLFKSS
jgi:WXG100 family type VII secretion target